MGTLNSEIAKTRQKCIFWQALVIAKKYSIYKAKCEMFPKVCGHLNYRQQYRYYVLLSGIEGGFNREFMSYFNRFDATECKKMLKIYSDKLHELKKLNKGGKNGQYRKI